MNELATTQKVNWVTDASDDHVQYLIAPTIKLMRSINVAELSIKLRDGKVAFVMLPEGEQAP